MPSLPSSLVDLAHAHGLATTRSDADGGETQVDEAVLTRLLSALGSEASDEKQCADELSALDTARWERVLPAHVVLREGWTPWVPVRLRAGREFEGVIVREDGERVPLSGSVVRVEKRQIGDVEYAETSLELPRSLPLGHHRLTVASGGVEHSCPLIVTPMRMAMPAALSGVKAWGVAAQLYGLRSDRSWGIGDAADLAELGTWAARSGADYVNVGPVNASDPVSTIDPNPYRPVSRRMLDPLAIRVEEIRELGYLSAAEHQLVEWHGDDARRLNLTDEVDRDAVWQSKRAALRMIFRVERSHRRRRDFEEFVAHGGRELEDYATWCVLAQQFGLPASGWPAEYADAGAQAVARFRAEHAEDIEFECWLQWIARAQFADAARETKAAGMRIGVVHDIAPGTIDGGFEQWARPGDHAPGVVVGARSQADARSGQISVIELGLAALTPAALARDGYAAWVALLRDAFAVSGGVRLERADMLFRQWWHVAGEPEQGTFVHFDHEALIGILLLEAQRAGVVVVAGDEHDDTPWIRDYLTERGLVTSHVLWHEGRGAQSLDATADVHRRAAGLAAKDDEPAAILFGEAGAAPSEPRGTGLDPEAGAGARAAFVAGLEERAVLDAEMAAEERIAAVHRHLAGGPWVMFTVRVGDLVGDVRRTGQHGVDHVHELWRRPLAGADTRSVGLDALMTSRRAKRVIRVVRRDG